jgi:hypothetical protein
LYLRGFFNYCIRFYVGCYQSEKDITVIRRVYKDAKHDLKHDEKYEGFIVGDISLKIMWTLLKIPGHAFENRNKGYTLKEKTSYGDVFDELAKLNLINKVGKEDYANMKQSKWVVELSNF